MADLEKITGGGMRKGELVLLMAREGVGRSSAAYADWTTEALVEYEQWLYEDEVKGGDVWFERDRVLWELNRPERQIVRAHKR